MKIEWQIVVLFYKNSSNYLDTNDKTLPSMHATIENMCPGALLSFPKRSAEASANTKNPLISFIK